MSMDKFNLSWINHRENYDAISRSDLLPTEYKKNKEPFRKIIDMGCGNGSFLRWCYKKKIMFDEMLLIDHDKKLLYDFFPATVKFLKNYSHKITKSSFSTYEIKKNNVNKIRNINIVNINILDGLKYINEYNLVSFSAISDLLSKKIIRSILDRINQNKSIYFSICFDGNIKWSIKHNFDKYINMMFNRHQQNDKGTGNAMGAKSIKYIETYGKKKNYNVKIKDSSWIITSLTPDHIKFKKMYLDTIYNGLKHDQNVDRKILKEWYQFRLKTIKLKKDRVIVGHKDILVLT